MSLTNIIIKIQKLRRLEKSPYPEEAEVAKRKADALIEKHGLSYKKEFFGKDEHFDWTECTEDWQQELYSYIEKFNLRDHLEEEGGFILITLIIEFCMKYGYPHDLNYLSGYRQGVEQTLMYYYGEKSVRSNGEGNMKENQSAGKGWEAEPDEIRYTRYDDYGEYNEKEEMWNEWGEDTEKREYDDYNTYNDYADSEEEEDNYYAAENKYNDHISHDRHCEYNRCNETYRRYTVKVEDLTLKGFQMSTCLITDLLDGSDISKTYGEDMLEYLKSL